MEIFVSCELESEVVDEQCYKRIIEIYTVKILKQYVIQFIL